MPCNFPIVESSIERQLFIRIECFPGVLVPTMTGSFIVNFLHLGSARVELEKVLDHKEES